MGSTGAVVIGDHARLTLGASSKHDGRMHEKMSVILKTLLRRGHFFGEGGR